MVLQSLKKQEENREVKSEDEKEEIVNARNDYLKKTAALEKKYTSNSESSIETMNQYQKSLKSLSSVSKSAETQAQKSLNDAINTANGNNKEQKEPKKTSIMGDVSDYTKRINSSQFINTKSLNSRENNPPNNIPLPQELNNTRYGLFNKYNLPPSSRPNVIDIFDNTDSLNDNVIKQDELSGNGNIFLPKLVMS